MKCPDFKALFPEINESDRQCTPLARSGSNRNYWRLTTNDGSSVIATQNNNIAENEAFFAIDDALRRAGVNVPEILAVSPDKSTYLQSDLGAVSLYDLIKSHDPALAEMINASLDQLARVHWRLPDDFDFDVCFPVSQMSNVDIGWDLNYFKYCYLKPAGIEFDELALEQDFSRLTADILHYIDLQPRNVFMLRDFQSRNIMIDDNRPWFIDFQGGRRGLFLYDVVSFAWQGRAGFTREQRNDFVARYMQTACLLEPSLQKYPVDEALPIVVLFRMLQVLGAYGFRGNIEGKATFKAQIPAALANIDQVRDELRHRFPAIFNAIPHAPKPDMTREGLTVTVRSFSFRKGYPTDISGDGGGFVFDCRALHNPGRYEQYKPLTGLDAEVVDFLERQPSVAAFLADAERLVDAAVDKYLERGFNNLQVSFGCTGGRHRSVYTAEMMARHLAQRKDVNVHLVHVEQHIDRWL